MTAPSTLIAVIGENSHDVVRRVAAGSINVSAELVSEGPNGLAARSDYLRTTWINARRHSLVYTLVNADPLEPVVDEWAKRLLGEDNELELAIAAAGTRQMPDYYLIDESLGQPALDWYLSNMRGLAPSRVVPMKMEPGPLAARLAHLPYGRPFPSRREVAATARDFIPLPDLIGIEHQFD